MDIYELEQTPRQSFLVARESDIYNFIFKGFDGFTLVDVLKNDGLIFAGAQCLVNQPLLPKQYTAGNGGYFALLSESDIIPTWNDFGSSVSLAWVNNG